MLYQEIPNRLFFWNPVDDNWEVDKHTVISINLVACTVWYSQDYHKNYEFAFKQEHFIVLSFWFLFLLHVFYLTFIESKGLVVPLHDLKEMAYYWTIF